MSINIKLLKEICEVAGAPGHEQRVREIVLREIKKLADDISIDNMGNVIAVKKGKTDQRVMVAAHMDEIGFMVTHIDDQGFLRFTPLGGFDPKTLTAQRVVVHGKKDIIGVMGSKPIHVMTPAERERVVPINEYFIDLGMSKKEVEKIVKVGDTVTANIDTVRRQKIANNHTATHLLHWALHKVLGEHVKQAGSVVEPTRLRFDFSHHKALTQQEIHQIEDIYRLIYVRGHNITNALEIVEQEIPNNEIRNQIVTFIRSQKDGVVKGI